MLPDSEWLSQKLALGRTGQVTAQPLCSSENVEGSLARRSPCSEFGALPSPPGAGLAQADCSPGGRQRGLPFPLSHPGEHGRACLTQALPPPHPRCSHLCSGPACRHQEETRIPTAFRPPLLGFMSMSLLPRLGWASRHVVSEHPAEQEDHDQDQDSSRRSHHQFLRHFQLT